MGLLALGGGEVSAVITFFPFCREDMESSVRTRGQEGPIPGSASNWRRTPGDLIIKTLEDLEEYNLKKLKNKLSDYSKDGWEAIPRGNLEKAGTPIATKELMINTYGEQGSLDVLSDVLKHIGLMGPAEKLDESRAQLGIPKMMSAADAIQGFRKEYMEDIKKYYQRIKEHTSRPGEAVSLQRRYTRLLLMRGYCSQTQKERDIRGTARRGPDSDCHTSSEDRSPTSIPSLFDPADDGFTPEIVVLQGPAGMGKTWTSRKILLDWASGNLYQDRFEFVFFLSCRELNTIRGPISLLELLSRTCRLQRSHLLASLLRDPGTHWKCLLIIDGFDEFRWDGEEEAQTHHVDVSLPASMGVILQSLLRKCLLRAASLIITVRPMALSRLDSLIGDSRRVEILGFPREECENYFHQFFPEAAEAEKALSIIKRNDILFSLCKIPIVCWIVCTVLKPEIRKDLDLIQCKTITSIYLLYLKGLIKFHSREKQEKRMNECLRKLCALANEGVLSQKILFEEEDLERHGLTLSEVESVFLSRDLFISDLENVSCYSFIHLSVQELLAALYCVLDGGSGEEKGPSGGGSGEERGPSSDGSGEEKGPSGDGSGEEKGPSGGGSGEEKGPPSDGSGEEKGPSGGGSGEEKGPSGEVRILLDVLQEISLLDLWRDYSHLALAVRFLFGLCNKRDIEAFSKSTGCRVSPLQAKSLLTKWLTAKSDYTFRDPDLYYLYESQDEEFLRTVISGSSRLELIDSNYMDEFCYCLQACGGVQTVTMLDIPQHPQKLEALAPYLHKCRELSLYICDLSPLCCDVLHSALITSRTLIRLHLSNIWGLGDARVKTLCEGLRHPDCILQELSLSGCGVSPLCCDVLHSALITSRTLISLHLSSNSELGDAGVKTLCEGLRHPDCILQELELSQCGLSPLCCDALHSALITSRTLIRLTLSSNKELGDAGVQTLCEGLRHPDCILQELRLSGCFLSPLHCDALHSALITSRTLIRLDLSWNSELGDAGVKILCEGLRHPDCILQELSLSGCDLTPRSCEDLRSVITTNRSLTTLHLSCNPYGDSGLKILCEGLLDPDCTLQEIQLRSCDGTVSCQEELLSLLSTNRTLRRLRITLQTSEDDAEPYMTAFRGIGCTAWYSGNEITIKYKGASDSE